MQELAHALSRAERSVTRQLARAMEEEGCTVEDSRILLLLADGRGHTMTEVAEFALVPAPSVTRIVDRMVTHGLLHRTVDPSDRRRVRVHLTPRGWALKRRLDEILQREQDALLAGARARRPGGGRGAGRDRTPARAPRRPRRSPDLIRARRVCSVNRFRPRSAARG